MEVYRDFFYDLQGTFRGSCFQGQLFFWKTSSLKLLLPVITFLDYERAYLVEGFLHTLCSYLDFALAQL